MKIISINVNGIRAAARKGMFEWLEKVDADVICLQELKAQPDQIEGEPFHPKGYHTFFHSAEKKGYSGVGIYCKQKPDAIHYGFGEAWPTDKVDEWQHIDREGRYIQADFGELSVASLYMPSGSSKEERQQYKYDMIDKFEPVLQNMAESKRQYVICGDWNIAHKKADIKNWRGNQKHSGFLPEERQWFDWLFEEDVSELDGTPNSIDISKGRTVSGKGGFVDAFRVSNQQEEQYTWWSNRGQAWANNTGWRIDYHVVTANLKDKIVVGSDVIYKDERFSDHAPLIIEYKV